jgi:hypothetical protein
MTSTRQLVATATDGVALTANQTNVLVYAARQLQSATDNLARLLAATSRRLAEAVEALNEGLRVNELGVLQSAGLDGGGRGRHPGGVSRSPSSRHIVPLTYATRWRIMQTEHRPTKQGARTMNTDIDAMVAAVDERSTATNEKAYDAWCTKYGALVANGTEGVDYYQRSM